MQTYKKENGSTWFIGQMEYVKPLETALQPNQISQGLYRCSPMAKRILAYVIADMNVVKWNNSKHETYETVFKCSDFAKSLGLQRTGKKQKELIKQALIELQQSYIAIDTGEKFETFSWVTHSVYAEKEHKIAVEINHHLGQALLEFKKGYTAIQLLEMGKLQSFYAMRFYELALSYSGFDGKKNNKKNSWYFEYSVEQIRLLFQIKEDEYSGRMTNFITKVIQKPLEEVCEKTNINISFDKIKNGKNVIGFIFYCSRKKEELKITKTDSKEIKDEKLAVIAENKKVEKLKKEHYDKWQEIFEMEMRQPCLFGGEEIKKAFAENKANLELLKLFGDEK